MRESVMREKAMAIYESLADDPKNVFQRVDLENEHDIPGGGNGAAFREIVNYGRAQMHLPIGSGSVGEWRGYFLVNSPARAAITYRHMWSRVAKIADAVKGLEQGLNEAGVLQGEFEFDESRS